MDREQLELQLLAAKIEYYNMCSQKMKADAERPAASRSRRRPVAKPDESSSDDKPVETTKSAGGASRKRAQPTPTPDSKKSYTHEEVDTWDKKACSDYLTGNGEKVPQRITLLDLQGRVKAFIKSNPQKSSDEESSEDEEEKVAPAKRKVAIRFEAAPKLDDAKETEKAAPLSNAERLVRTRNELNNKKAASQSSSQSSSSSKSRTPLPLSLPPQQSSKKPALPANLGKKVANAEKTEDRKANVLKEFEAVSKEARSKRDATQSSILEDSDEEQSDAELYNSDEEQFSD